MNTLDELVKLSGSGIAPANTFASAAEPSFSTYPAQQDTGEEDFSAIVKHGVKEYVAPPSNLPMQVSAATIAQQNAERGDKMWTAKSAAVAPLLSGTQVFVEGE